MTLLQRVHDRYPDLVGGDGSRVSSAPTDTGVNCEGNQDCGGSNSQQHGVPYTLPTVPELSSDLD